MRSRRRAPIQQLIDQFSYTQQQLADSVGKSRSHIANTLRLLTLPESVRRHIEDGALTAGHARALVATDAPQHARREDHQARPDGARGGRPGAQRGGSRKAGRPRVKAQKDANTLALEKQLERSARPQGRDVNKGRAGGTLDMRYKTLDQLDDVCNRLVKSP